MIGLYIYLSGILLVWCVFAHFAFIKKEEVRKRDVLPFITFSIMSYLSIIIFIGFIIDEYIKEHGDEVIFNRKTEDDE